MNDDWGRVWSTLRSNLAAQPLCKQHPAYPCVATLARRQTNDILAIDENAITVRSHLTGKSDRIAASVFRRWWRHLKARKVASLQPGEPGNPDADRSRLVGAILVRCLPANVDQDPGNANLIRLVKP